MHFILNRRLLSVASLVAVGALLSVSRPAAHAAFIAQPTDVSATSEFSGREDDQSIDGSGLSDDTIVETGDPVPASFPTHTDSNPNDTMWLSEDVNDGGTITPTITFDLGDTFELSGVHVWNYNEFASTSGADLSDRGVNEVDISFSTTSMTSGFGAAQTHNFPQAPAASTYEGDDVSFTSAVNARYVQFDIKSTHGSTRFVGLSEVRFTVVPEPASAALLLCGALMIGGPRRSRRNRSVVQNR